MSERKTTTFDFGGPVEDSSLTDVDSNADTLIRGGASKGNVFHRIRHEPFRSNGKTNWEKWGALAGIVAVPVAVVFGLIQAF